MSPAHEVIFQVKDKEMLTVSWEVFRMFAIYSPQNDPEARPRDPIPLPEIDAATLKKARSEGGKCSLPLRNHSNVQVVEYCEYHKNNDSQENDPLSHSPDGQQKNAEWDSKFIRVDEKMLFSIILAANYLGIEPLLYLATATVGKLMKGKTPQEMERLFNTVNDFTPEEEAQIKREEGWEEWNPTDIPGGSRLSDSYGPTGGSRPGHGYSAASEPSLLD